MKSLEVDALKAQAVIGLAKEMQEKSKLPTVPDTGVPGQLGEGLICHPRGGDVSVTHGADGGDIFVTKGGGDISVTHGGRGLS